MEKYMELLNFEGDKCFEMNIRKYDRKVRFKVKYRDSDGVIQGEECDTGETIEFNRNKLLKVEYSTLTEIDCDDCA